MPSIEETLANSALAHQQSAAALDQMTGAVSSGIAQMDAKKIELQSAVDGFVDGAAAAAPLINLCADGGRFCDGGDQLLAGNFVPPAYLSPYNGSTALSDAGKFINNNDDYGGTAGPLPEPVAALFADLGGGARYGMEFHVAEFTQGSGSASGGLSLICGARAVPPKITISYFIRATIGSFSTTAAAKINGADYDGGSVSDGKWRHVILKMGAPLGYNNGIPRIFAAPGSVVQIACLSILSGHLVHLDQNHKSPIPGSDAAWR